MLTSADRERFDLVVDGARLQEIDAWLEREGPGKLDGASAQAALTASIAAREPQWDAWSDAVGERVERDGLVRIRGVPVASDAVLVAFGAALGVVTREGNGEPGELVYDVRPRGAGAQLAFSERRDPFPLHTDSVPARVPHRWVGLGCLLAPTNGGGESLLVPARRVVSALLGRGLAGAVDALVDPVFPVLLPADDERGRVAKIAILDDPYGEPGIRFRDDLIAAGCRAAPSVLDQRHARALEALRTVLARGLQPHRVLLRPGDVLLLDNRRLLHGRTAIARTAERTLRRLKIHARTA